MPPEKLLFVLPSLPRPTVSVRQVMNGTVPVSGSISSFVSVAEALARRGGPVAVVSLDGRVLTETSARCFDQLVTAIEWLDGGMTVLCSWGNTDTVEVLDAAGISPLLWLQTHPAPEVFRDLEKGRIRGLVVPSDLTRLPFLHHRKYRRLGRVHNPLNPFFAEATNTEKDRYSSKAVVFTGYIGETKGAHRALEAWRFVREQVPDATLTIIGSAKLYGDDHRVGRLGVADHDFEERYLRPLIDQFGSLENGGIRFAGLLSPADLRIQYGRSALGLVNLNWIGSTETFCCSGVEMLAAGLPVVSLARGGLPETIGESGGAVLLRRPDLAAIGQTIVELLQDPGRLAELAEAGSRYVRLRYDLDLIANHWSKLLAGDEDSLDRLSGQCYRRGRRGRYYSARVAGKFGLGFLLDTARRVVRRNSN